MAQKNKQKMKQKQDLNVLDEARRVFDIEIEALQKMRDALDETFEKILDEVTHCKGKVIITGMGKPGHIASKMAATLSSLGTPTFFLHPGEAMHGDLGMISANDLVIAISYSGESDEIVNILPNIKMIGARLIGITGNAASTLAQASDIVQVLPPFQEACYLGLAPTSSTTVELCYGDALAVVASVVYGFKEKDFGKFHPAGALGKKLVLKVSDLMSTGDKDARVDVHSTLKDAIIVMGKKGLGIVNIVDEDGHLCGVVTDGDLRRQLEKGVDVYGLQVDEVMTREPAVITPRKLAVVALKALKERNVSALPVVDRGVLVGTIRLQDIIGAGIVG